MVNDPIIIKRLQENPTDDVATLYKIDEMMSRPRILDSEPVKGVADPVTGVLQQHGIRADFNSMFIALFNPDLVKEQATLDLTFANRGIKKCDYHTWAVLKTLIFLGASPYEKVAETCRELFMLTLIVDKDPITKYDILNILWDNMTDNYHTQLEKAVMDSIYSKEEVSDYCVFRLLEETKVTDEAIEKAKDLYKGFTYDELQESVVSKIKELEQRGKDVKSIKRQKSFSKKLEFVVINYDKL